MALKAFSGKIKWTIVITLVIAIKVISAYPDWVEKLYTHGIYPLHSALLRYLFGWIPFSVGDILYALILALILYRLSRFIKKASSRKISKAGIGRFVQKSAYLILWIFVIFYGLWGLNYSRSGIASQLGLPNQQYTGSDLDTLVQLLHHRLNNQASLLKPAMRDSFVKKKSLFQNAAFLYKATEKKYPFLKYRGQSIKPSLLSYLSNYLGFQGYYNPFTGEAQVNTTVPIFIEPFVASHEIAHQLGYARESEANFVGFLACRQHPSMHFKYSVYFNMYHYAIRELARLDSNRANTYNALLEPQVQRDIDEYKLFYMKYRNPIEPYVGTFYGYFLKANNQPKGKESYNEVVNWLIAYYKKYGMGAI